MQQIFPEPIVRCSVVLGIGRSTPREGKKQGLSVTLCPENQSQGKTERPRECSFQQEGFCSLLLLTYTQRRDICDEFSQSRHTCVTTTWLKKQHGTPRGPFPVSTTPLSDF